MAISVDVQRIEMADCTYFDDFTVVYVGSSGGGVVRLYFEGSGHAEKADAVAEAINRK